MRTVNSQNHYKGKRRRSIQHPLLWTVWTAKVSILHLLRCAAYQMLQANGAWKHQIEEICLPNQDTAVSEITEVGGLRRRAFHCMLLSARFSIRVRAVGAEPVSQWVSEAGHQQSADSPRTCDLSSRGDPDCSLHWPSEELSFASLATTLFVH